MSRLMAIRAFFSLSNGVLESTEEDFRRGVWLLFLSLLL